MKNFLKNYAICIVDGALSVGFFALSFFYAKISIGLIFHSIEPTYIWCARCLGGLFLGILSIANFVAALFGGLLVVYIICSPSEIQD